MADTVQHKNRIAGGAIQKKTPISGSLTRDGSPAGGSMQRPRDGISPTIAVEDIEGGHRITITDVNGEHTVDILNGIQGDPGEKGDPGEGVPDGGEDGQVIVMGDEVADWKTPTVELDTANAAGGAIVGEAMTDEPGYTPAGDITLETEAVTPRVPFNYHYDSSKMILEIKGIKVEPLDIPKGAAFHGTGVKFKPGFEEDST